MRTFSDLNIKRSPDKKLFNCPSVSIIDIINCEIIIRDFITDVTTKHGPGRCIILFEHEGQLGKFFSNAKNIKEVLAQITHEDLPFITTIKSTSIGKGKIYEFI